MFVTPGPALGVFVYVCVSVRSEQKLKHREKTVIYSPNRNKQPV